MGNTQSKMSKSNLSPITDTHTLPKQYSQHIYFSNYFTSNPKYLRDLFDHTKTVTKELNFVLSFIQSIAESTRRYSQCYYPPKTISISNFKGAKYLSSEFSALSAKIAKTYLRPSDTTYEFLLKKFNEQLTVSVKRREKLKSSFSKILKKEADARKSYVAAQQILHTNQTEIDNLCVGEQSGTILPSSPKYSKFKQLTDNIAKIKGKVTAYEKTMTKVTFDLSQEMKSTADELQDIMRNLLKSYKEAVAQFLEINMECTKSIAEILTALSHTLSCVNVEDDLTDFGENVGRSTAVDYNDADAGYGAGGYDEEHTSARREYAVFEGNDDALSAHTTAKYTVTAVYDFEKQGEGEMSFMEGDVIEVYNDEGNWWSGKNLRTGDIGLFPYNYIKK